jgi:predicted ATPase
LAVFAGACTMLAVESVVPGNGSSALDTVSALVDNSMLQIAARGGEPRFVMLETIRDYALERLEASGEEIDARRAHVAYFRARAQEAESALNHRHQPRRWHQVCFIEGRGDPRTLGEFHLADGFLLGLLLST